MESKDAGVSTPAAMSTTSGDASSTISRKEAAALRTQLRETEQRLESERTSAQQARETAESHAASLSQRCRELQAEIHEHKSEAATFQARISALEDAAARDHAPSQALQAQLSHERAVVKQVQAQRERDEARIQDLNTQLHAVRSTAAETQAQLHAAQTHVRQAEEAALAAQHEQDLLQMRVYEAEERCEAIQADMESQLVRQATGFTEQIQALQTRTIDAQEARQAAATATAQKHTQMQAIALGAAQQLANLREELESLRADATRDLHGLWAASQASITATVRGMRQQAVLPATHRADVAEAEASALREALADVQAQSQATGSRSETERVEARRAQAELRAELAKARDVAAQRDEEVAAATARTEALQHDMAELRRDLAAARRQHAAAQQSVLNERARQSEALAAVRAQGQTSRAQLSQVTSECATLQQQLASARADVEAGQQSIRRLEDAARSSSVELHRVQHVAAQAQAQIEALESQLASVRTELSAEQAARRAADTRVATAEANAGHQAARVEDLEADLADAQAHATDLAAAESEAGATVRRLELQLAQVQRELHDAEASGQAHEALAAAQHAQTASAADIQELLRHIHQSQADGLQRLAGALASLDARISERLDHSPGLQQHTDALTRGLDMVSARIQALAENIAISHEALMQQMAAGAGAESSTHDLDRQVEQLRQLLDSANAAQVAAEQRARAMTDELAALRRQGMASPPPPAPSPAAAAADADALLHQLDTAEAQNELLQGQLGAAMKRAETAESTAVAFQQQLRQSNQHMEHLMELLRVQRSQPAPSDRLTPPFRASARSQRDRSAQKAPTSAPGRHDLSSGTSSPAEPGSPLRVHHLQRSSIGRTPQSGRGGAATAAAAAGKSGMDPAMPLSQSRSMGVSTTTPVAYSASPATRSKRSLARMTTPGADPTWRSQHDGPPASGQLDASTMTLGSTGKSIVVQRRHRHRHRHGDVVDREETVETL